MVNNRYQTVISRQSDEKISEDHWLKQFEKNIQKGGVQSRQVDKSLFDQINSIMDGSKNKHSSVESVVQEMQERSGLKAYLDSLNKSSAEEKLKSNKTKTASDNNGAIDKKIEMIPIVIQKKPGIKNTLENYIRDTKGNLPIPAIIEKIKSIHQRDVSDSKDWDDDKLIRLVSKLNLKAKVDNPDSYQEYQNLGSRDVMNDSEIDPSNTDAFSALNPAKF